MAMASFSGRTSINMPTLLLLLLSILLVVSIASSPVTAFRGRVGGRSEVKDVKSNEQVQELGRFCVEEYNRMCRQRGRGDDEVSFSKVVAAETQVVAGVKYYLKIEATQHGTTRVFDSVVVVKPWLHSKQLLNFGPTKDRILGS